jgi:hypothetical protein
MPEQTHSTVSEKTANAQRFGAYLSRIARPNCLPNCQWEEFAKTWLDAPKRLSVQVFKGKLSVRADLWLLQAALGAFWHIRVNGSQALYWF